jgi:hypothetical protein
MTAEELEEIRERLRGRIESWEGDVDDYDSDDDDDDYDSDDDGDDYDSDDDDDDYDSDDDGDDYDSDDDGDDYDSDDDGDDYDSDDDGDDYDSDDDDDDYDSDDEDGDDSQLEEIRERVRAELESLASSEERTLRRSRSGLEDWIYRIASALGRLISAPFRWIASVVRGLVDGFFGD